MTKLRVLLTSLVAAACLIGTATGCQKKADDEPGTSGSEASKEQSEKAEKEDEGQKEQESAKSETDDETKLDGKVLVVLSGADSIELDDGTTVETGFFMNEMAVPGRAMHKAGLELVYATPDGEAANMDPKSDAPEYFEDKASFMKHRAFLQSQGLIEGEAEYQSFETILESNLDDYVAVYVPGGLAPTVDLATNETLGKLLEHFHGHTKTTAMLCHGPAALLSTLPEPATFIEKVHGGKSVDPPSDWMYEGYELTVISKKEDQQLEEKLGAGLAFYPEDVLRAAGAEVEVKAREEGFVTTHEELITGQNPMADREFTETLLESIRAQ